MTNKKYTVGSFFCGMGGIDKGFESTDNFKVVYANEIDTYPISIYESNSDIRVDNRSIEDVEGAKIPNFDVMVGGFPCQPFSLSGKLKGFDDTRGTMFFEMMRIIKEKKEMGNQPKVVMFENVKNLLNHDKGNTFKVIKMTLEGMGYSVKYKVLNSWTHGNVPQNRERIFIVGFLNDGAYNRFEFPSEVKSDISVSDILLNKVDRKYYVSEKIQNRFKITNGIDSNIIGTTKPSFRKIGQRDTVYSCLGKRIGCLMASDYKQPKQILDNISLKEGKMIVRKLTPRECARLQGFSDNFILPTSVSDSRLYKAIGNSVTVSVIKRIAENIYATL